MHTQVTLNEMTEMLPYILPAKQPMILLGMTGAGKTQYCKTVVREAYAKTLGLMADEIGFVIRATQQPRCLRTGRGCPTNERRGWQHQHQVHQATTHSGYRSDWLGSRHHIFGRGRTGGTRCPESCFAYV
jgi:hypothetical protein